MANKPWNMSVDLLPSTTATFNIGNSSKKWIVNGYTLGDACTKGVTDNSSSTAPSSSDTNVITGRTLYYAFENAGVSAITTAQIDSLFS